MRWTIQRLLPIALSALFAGGLLCAQTYAPPAAGDYGANGSNTVYVNTMTPLTCKLPSA